MTDTGTGLRRNPPGGQRDKSFLADPADRVQTSLSLDALDKMRRTQTELRALFTAAMRRAGGVDWLASALDRKPSYASKITEAVNGADGRAVQLDWLAPLLDDHEAQDLLVGWLLDRCGYEPGVRRRVVTQQQIDAAAREVVSETSGAMKDAMREAIAKKLGVRPDDVKL